MDDISPFEVMWTLWWGMLSSVGYGAMSFVMLWRIKGKPEAQLFLLAYTSSFRTIISLGLIFGAALIIWRYQNALTQTIEAAFAKDELSDTGYFVQKKALESKRNSLEFSGIFIVVGFFIFFLCRFPLPALSKYLMVIAACAEYALGVYVGRKLLRAGMMLHLLRKAKVTHNLFAKRELDDINTYVNVVSTLTIIFVYVHVMNYYNGPFKYDGPFGASIKPFLILPAVIATPVLLIFNFYPRAVVKKLYRESIELEINKLQEMLVKETSSLSEKRSYLLQFDKMCRDELRYNLQLTINDLPFGITILLMVLQPLLKR